MARCTSITSSAAGWGSRIQAPPPRPPRPPRRAGCFVGSSPVNVSVTSAVRFFSSTFKSALVAPSPSKSASSVMRLRKWSGYSGLNVWPSFSVQMRVISASPFRSSPTMVNLPIVYCAPAAMCTATSTAFFASSMTRSDVTFVSRYPARRTALRILSSPSLTRESGIYDFLNIQKKWKSGQDVTESMIAAAIGGIWATREVQPLIPFLREKARTGNLTIGGLDDQLGRGTYAQREMSSDLVKYLSGEEQARCLAILQKHALWQYSADAPYSPNDKALILGCLHGIETRLSQASEAPWREYDRAMIESLKRSFARDFRQDLPKDADERILDENDRNQSMYLNFRWLLRSEER